MNNAYKEYGNVGVVTPLDAGFLLARPQNWRRKVDGMVVFQMLKGLDVRLLSMRCGKVHELVPYNTNQRFLDRLYIGALVAKELLGLSPAQGVVRPFELSRAKELARSCHFILAQHGHSVERIWLHEFHPKELKHSMSLDVEERGDGWQVGGHTLTDERGLRCDCGGESGRPCAHMLAVQRTTRHEDVISAIGLLDSIRYYTRCELDRLPFLKSVEIVWLGQC